MLVSCICNEESLVSSQMQDWRIRLKERPGHLHRKIWEWCFICEALAERGMLRPGKRGLGFAVGQEPMTALFARMGASITATDLPPDRAEAEGWASTGQHASGIAAINSRGLCDPAEFERLVAFKPADMNDIGPEFDGQYDFLWSSCAFEHLGDLQKGMQFVYNAMRCLKPGGFAVHTTEYNMSSNDATVDSGDTVLYRKRDIEEMAALLRSQGHAIGIDWKEGQGHADRTVDVPPYKQEVHLRLQIAQYVVTSFGMIVQKDACQPPAARTGGVSARLRSVLSSAMGR